MRNYLNNAVHTVFVMLGPKCNLRCRYCLQSPLRADREREAVDPEVLEFIRDIARNQCEPVSVHFYGGEPLMYQREVREIIEALDEEPNIRFSMISNGTLLTDELAGYLGASGVHYAVSWDGPNTEAVRGVDVFADPERRKRILGLRGLSLSSVISAYNYPLETLDALADLDREHQSLTGESLFVFFDEIMDTGLADRTLLAIDCDRVYREMSAVAAETEKALRGEDGNPWYANLGRRYVDRLQSGVEGRESFLRGTCACGNGYSVLNVDLRGKLYRCHNTDTVLGTIHDSYGQYLSNAVLHDPTRENAVRCEACPVVSICNAGCPLIGQEVRDAYYCRLKKAMFLPIVELVVRLSEEGGA